MIRTRDIEYLRLSIAVAEKAAAKGNHPFGAILVDAGGKIIAEGENTYLVDKGPGHAEGNLARFAAREWETDYLEKCTLYSSVEPCCMCAGTIYWANIGTLVYGMSERQLVELTGGHSENPTQDLPCDVVFAAGQRRVEVRGPFEEVAKDIAMVHRKFWNTRGTGRS